MFQLRGSSNIQVRLCCCNRHSRWLSKYGSRLRKDMSDSLSMVGAGCAKNCSDADETACRIPDVLTTAAMALSAAAQRTHFCT